MWYALAILAGVIGLLGESLVAFGIMILCLIVAIGLDDRLYPRNIRKYLYSRRRHRFGNRTRLH